MLYFYLYLKMVNFKVEPEDFTEEKYVDKATQTDPELFDFTEFVCKHMRDVGSGIIEKTLENKISMKKLIRLQKENIALKETLKKWNRLVQSYGNTLDADKNTEKVSNTEVPTTQQTPHDDSLQTASNILTFTTQWRPQQTQPILMQQPATYPEETIQQIPTQQLASIPQETVQQIPAQQLASPERMDSITDFYMSIGHSSSSNQPALQFNSQLSSNRRNNGSLRQILPHYTTLDHLPRPYGINPLLEHLTMPYQQNGSHVIAPNVYLSQNYACRQRMDSSDSVEYSVNQQYQFHALAAASATPLMSSLRLNYNSFYESLLANCTGGLLANSGGSLHTSQDFDSQTVDVQTFTHFER